MESQNGTLFWDELKDPLGDRKIKDLPPPAIGTMKDSDLFDPTTKKPNWQLVLKFLKQEGHLSK